MDHLHEHPIHPEHRQGDIPLGDGRLFTCTKRLREGHRTSMLFVAGLFRVDVTGRGEEVEIRMRNLSGKPIAGGVEETMQHSRAQAYDGTEIVMSVFTFEPLEGPVGNVRVTIVRPLRDRGERFACTAIATVQRRAA